MSITGWHIGIYITGPGGNRVSGCYVGLDRDGQTRDANGNDDRSSAGISVYESPDNVIGGGAGLGDVISGNHGAGVMIFGSGADNNTVTGDIIGLDVNEKAGVGNDLDGILISTPVGDPAGIATNTQIGAVGPGDGNVIAGNSAENSFGVEVLAARSTEIAANFIGVTGNGVAIPNDIGVVVEEAPATTIGLPGAGNVISGNATVGVFAGGSGTTGLHIYANKIGTTGDGSTAVPNHGDGIQLSNSGTDLTPPADAIIGGPGALGNLISGNSGYGIRLYQGARDQVIGNRLGTDGTGQEILLDGAGNPAFQKAGVVVQQSAQAQIGGAAAGAGNLISGNDTGLLIQGPGADGAQVEGNSIGVTASGGKPLGNTIDAIVINDASSAVIGFPKKGIPAEGCSGSCNVIANSGEDGVLVYGSAAVDNTIRGNSIFFNADQGIAFGDASDPSTIVRILPDHWDDSTSGPNRHLNFPAGVMATDTPDDPGYTALAATPGRLIFPGRRVVAGTTVPPQAGLIVDIYGLQHADDQSAFIPGQVSAYGEGRAWVGEAVSNSDGVFAVPLSAAAAAYETFSATVTDQSGDTSTFSQTCRPLSGGTNPDTSGDGICDQWKKNGIDYNGDGHVDLDLESRGATVGHKDVFAEVDYFAPFAPEQVALRMVVAAFNAAPVQNPDGRSGIRLHLYPDKPVAKGSLEPSADDVIAPPAADSSLTAEGYRQLKDGGSPTSCDGYFGTDEERSAT